MTAIRYELEGKRVQDPDRWSLIGSHPTEDAARVDETDYRQWNDSRTHKGWLDFRVVKITIAREVLQISKQTEPKSP